MYKDARHGFQEKAQRNSSLQSSTSVRQGKRARPHTSTTASRGLREARGYITSESFQPSHPKIDDGASQFLEIKPKELQRPIQKEDYENIYAVSTAKFLQHEDIANQAGTDNQFFNDAGDAKIEEEREDLENPELK